jgi:uncharacterized membrane protein
LYPWALAAFWAFGAKAFSNVLALKELGASLGQLRLSLHKALARALAARRAPIKELRLTLLEALGILCMAKIVYSIA